MNELNSKRSKTFKSQIPVLIRNGKSSNLTCRENKFCKKLPLSTASNVNKKADENFHSLNKDLVKKSSHSVERISPVKICKTDQINLRTCESHISNNYRTASKSSGLKLEKGLTRKVCQLVNTSPTEGCKENYIKAEGLSVSQDSNFVRTDSENFKISENFHCIKAEHVKKSSSEIENSISNESVKNTKYKFKSSKNKTQTAENTSINSKQNKNVKLLIEENEYEKENQGTFDKRCFPDQDNLKFEANELFRKMILSGKQPSPSNCKIMPGFRLSSLQAQRPSIYQKFEIHPNPFQEALQAIANISAKRGDRKPSIQKGKKITTASPCQGRNSCYTPCTDPKIEVMKSIEAFKAKQVQKSALKNSKKKVTFNLNVEEYTAKIDDCESEPVVIKISECRLEQIKEGSAENTPRPKLYTPRPISFFPNSRSVNEYSSPEFLTEKTLVSSSAPIYTPLALRSMAKSSAISPDAALSPVRLKLDFTTMEKGTPNNEISKVCDSHFKNYTSRNTFRKIITAQRQLDDLADQECCSWLLNDYIPVVCERDFQNPVAATLTEGDEMHFLPIRQ